jgi:molybdenum transport protein
LVYVLGCNIPTLIPNSIIEEWIREDIPYSDLTTAILGIASKEAIATLYSRERVVVCGLEEAAQVYKYVGASVETLISEGEWVEAGSPILRAVGPAGSLHAAWRVAQTLAAIGSSVATYARFMVERARKVNPNVIVAVVRKAPPGLRHLYYRCILCAGAALHRAGISDTILVFPNHTRVVGGLEKVLERLKKARSMIGERKVIIEVESVDEALKAAESGIVDEVQLDHISPDELRTTINAIRKLNPNVKVAVGGGITLENVEDYASTGVDVIVTSAPYWVKPADFTTKIEPLH